MVTKGGGKPAFLTLSLLNLSGRSGSKASQSKTGINFNNLSGQEGGLAPALLPTVQLPHAKH
jgi:hypothetical protein